MNPPSIDLKDILDDVSSLGLTFATDLHVGGLPTEPDLCVSLTDTGGDAPEANFNYERPHMQLLVRGARGSYTAAMELAQDCRDELHAVANYTINGARYIGIWCYTDVAYIGPDENERPLFSVNFRIHRTTA